MRDDPAVRAIAAVAILAFTVRLAYTLLVAKRTPLGGDAIEFELVGGAIAAGQGFVLNTFHGPSYPTAHKPPLYPLLLGGLDKLGLSGYVAHQIFMDVVGTGTVILVMFLTRRLAGTRAAVIAGLIAAVYPAFLISDASLRAESLFAFLVAATLLAAHRAAERPSVARFALTGALVGLAAQARTEGLLLIAIPVLVLAWRAGSGGRLRLGGAAAAACVLVLAPWFVRCWIVFDQPVFISTNSGDLVAGANCPATYSGPLIGTWDPFCTAGKVSTNGAKASATLFHRGATYARHHTGRLPAVLTARALRTWGLFRPGQQLRIDQTEGRNHRAGQIARFMCYLMIVLAAAGAVLLRRRGRPLLVILSPIVLVVFVSLTAYGVTRFRIAGDLTLVVLSAIALDALLARAPGRGAQPV
jgi:4-amino-4-deoxy-L-arabinose transferase-like glycosyltransferase